MAVITDYHRRNAANNCPGFGATTNYPRFNTAADYRGYMVVPLVHCGLCVRCVHGGVRARRDHVRQVCPAYTAASEYTEYFANSVISGYAGTSGGLGALRARRGVRSLQDHRRMGKCSTFAAASGHAGGPQQGRRDLPQVQNRRGLPRVRGRTPGTPRSRRTLRTRRCQSTLGPREAGVPHVHRGIARIHGKMRHVRGGVGACRETAAGSS